LTQVLPGLPGVGIGEALCTLSRTNNDDGAGSVFSVEELFSCGREGWFSECAACAITPKLYAVNCIVTPIVVVYPLSLEPGTTEDVRGDCRAPD
jgi:hypothetical protein